VSHPKKGTRRLLPYQVIYHGTVEELREGQKKAGMIDHPPKKDLATAVVLEISQEDQWDSDAPLLDASVDDEEAEDRSIDLWNRRVDEIDSVRFVAKALEFIEKDSKKEKIYRQRATKWNDAVKVATRVLNQISCPNDRALESSLADVRLLLDEAPYQPPMFSPIWTGGVGKKRPDPMDSVIQFLDDRGMKAKQIAKVVHKAYRKRGKKPPSGLYTTITNRLKALRRKRQKLFSPD